MDHEKLREDLHALRDGELSGEARAQVLRHLGECSQCRLEYDRWERMSALFRAPAAPAAAETERFVRRVMDAFDPPRPRSLWAGGSWLIPALGAGMAALALLFASAPARQPQSAESLLFADAQSQAADESGLPAVSSLMDSAAGFAPED